MEIYYTIHILLFLCCFLYKKNQQIQKTILKFWIVFITLFGGLRWNVGTDWDSYLYFFYDINFDTIFKYERHDGADTMEPLFSVLNLLVRTFFQKFFILNILEVLIVQIAYYKFSTYHFPKIPLLCYSFMMVVFPAYFPVRSTLALAISLFSFRFIKERRILPFLALTLIAYFIHQKSIVLLPMYWIGKCHFKGWFLFSCFICFFVMSKIFQSYFISISLLLGGSVGEKALHYTGYQTVEKILPYTTLLLNGLFLSLYLYFRKVNKLYNDDWYNALLNLFLMYCGIIFIFSNGMSDLVRLIGNFFPAHCILFVSCFEWSNRINNKLLSACIVTFFFAYYLYRIPQCFSDVFFMFECVPYKTIFDYSVIQ